MMGDSPKIFCKECLVFLPENTNQCPFCGKIINEVATEKNITEEVNTFPCPDCGTIIAEIQTECPLCGRLFAGIEEKESEKGDDSKPLALNGIAHIEEDEQVICSNCKATISRYAITCPGCGTSFESNMYQCPDCYGEISEEDETCPHCGCVFSEGDNEEDANEQQHDTNASDESEFECSDCGGIIGAHDSTCPHCGATLNENEPNEIESTIAQATTSFEKRKEESKEKFSNPVSRVETTGVSTLELKLFERSELKNCIRELLKSKEGVLPEELVQSRSALEGIFKQLEDGTTLHLSGEEIGVLRLFFTFIVSQPQYNSTLKIIQEKFYTFIAEKK